jgi:hypothetical protein
MRLGDSEKVPDTLQCWIASTCAWRIRTYAIDHDIHTHQVDGTPDELLVLASEGNRKHYVLSAEHVLHFSDCTDRSQVQSMFQAIGLEPRLEIAASRFAFWTQIDGRTASRS